MQKQAKITSKGQITIPVEVRKILGVRAGDKLLSGTTRLAPVSARCGKECSAGLLKGHTVRAPVWRGASPHPSRSVYLPQIDGNYQIVVIQGRAGVGGRRSRCARLDSRGSGPHTSGSSLIKDQHRRGDHRRPQPALVADGRLCHIRGAHDFVRQTVDLLFLVPGAVGVELHIQGCS